MPMGIERKVSLTPPCTLADLEEFVQAAREMGVPETKELHYDITPGYHDQRESSPGSFTLVARP